MIGLDTNVLLRLIIDDDSAQSARAHRLVADRCTPRDPAYVAPVVMVELAWVLQDSFARSKADTLALFDHILALADVEVDAILPEAISRWRGGAADFADYVIGLAGRAAGCVATATFDRHAARSPEFMAVP